MASYLFSLHKLGKLDNPGQPGYIPGYRNNDEIVTSLAGVKLINFKEFSRWFKDPGAIRVQPIRDATHAYERTEEGVEEEREQANDAAMKSAVKVLAEEVCQDRIADHYVQSALSKTYDSRFYDLIVAVAPGYEQIDALTVGESPTVRAKRKIDMVVGFIIAQLGECQLHPHAWAVNLICTRPIISFVNGQKYSIKGTILMGAYLFCIKLTESAEQIGLLELAYGYVNVGGFFSYTKSGFSADIQLFNPICFEDIENLPMSVVLDHYTPEQIIGMATGRINRPVEEIRGDYGLYSLGYPDRGDEDQEEKQSELGEVLMKAFQLEYLEFLLLNGQGDDELFQQFSDYLTQEYKLKNFSLQNVRKHLNDTRRLIERIKSEFIEMKRRRLIEEQPLKRQRQDPLFSPPRQSIFVSPYSLRSRKSFGKLIGGERKSNRSKKHKKKPRKTQKRRKYRT